MKTVNRSLVLKQVDNKMKPFSGLAGIPRPGEGWIQAIRTALNMTQEQLAKKMDITAQSLSDFEKREKNGTITLHSLQQVAKALNMELVYAIVPREETLEEIIDKKAAEKAREIVNRTAKTMELEDQGNEPGALLRAFENKKNELKNEMPRFLWE
jgi:predicted DNA-binding mobile mystery protein A